MICYYNTVFCAQTWISPWEFSPLAFCNQFSNGAPLCQNQFVHPIAEGSYAGMAAWGCITSVITYRSFTRSTWRGSGRPCLAVVLSETRWTEHNVSLIQTQISPKFLFALAERLLAPFFPCRLMYDIFDVCILLTQALTEFWTIIPRTSTPGKGRKMILEAESGRIWFELWPWRALVR